MSAVNWSNWQKCPVCFAALGDPCVSLSGSVVAAVVVYARKPHHGRKPRAGGA